MPVSENSRSPLLTVSIMMIIFSSVVGLGAVTHVEAPSATSSATTLPIHVQSCVIEDELNVAAHIESFESYEARSDFMSLIESFEVKVGDTVKPGQLLATCNTESIKSMLRIFQDYAALYIAQLKIAQKNLEIVKGRRSRLSSLLDKGIIPQSDIDDADRQVLNAQGSYQQIQRGLDEMKKNIDQYELQIKNSNIYSQLNGVVTQLIVDPRSMTGAINVMPGTLIAKVERPGHYKAEAQLLDTQVHRVKQGMKADVFLPDGTHLDGTLTSVSTLPYHKKPSNGRADDTMSPPLQGGEQKQDGQAFYRATIEFHREGAILPEGLLATATIVLNQEKIERCLPWNAIESMGGVPTINAFDARQGWSKLPVKIGRHDGYNVQILDPLPNALIVSSKLW